MRWRRSSAFRERKPTARRLSSGQIRASGYMRPRMSAPASDLVRKRFARSCLWIAASCCFRGCPERSFGITWICSARQSCRPNGPLGRGSPPTTGTARRRWSGRWRRRRNTAFQSAPWWPRRGAMRLPFMFSGAQGMFLSRMAAHSGWRTSIFPIPPGRIPLVWYSGYMKRGSVSFCGRSPSTKSRGRMSRSMRKMSWTGRMPSPGASASTTQMGVPIPSRRDTGSPAP